jgi:hypothetical protein
MANIKPRRKLQAEQKADKTTNNPSQSKNSKNFGGKGFGQGKALQSKTLNSRRTQSR